MKKLIKRKDGTTRVCALPSGVSLTKQNFKDECNVHNILEKHKRVGVMKVNKGYENPMYDDFTQVPDYQEAQNIIIKAEEQFDSLPATIREKFQNDPSLFLEFCTNENNLDQMIELGLRAPISPSKDENSSSKGKTSQSDVNESTETNKSDSAKDAN